MRWKRAKCRSDTIKQCHVCACFWYLKHSAKHRLITNWTIGKTVDFYHTQSSCRPPLFVRAVYQKTFWQAFLSLAGRTVSVFTRRKVSCCPNKGLCHRDNNGKCQYNLFSRRLFVVLILFSARVLQTVRVVAQTTQFIFIVESVVNNVTNIFRASICW